MNPGIFIIYIDAVYDIRSHIDTDHVANLHTRNFNRKRCGCSLSNWPDSRVYRIGMIRTC